MAAFKSSYPDPVTDDTPPFREFNVSNHLLGDRAALDAAFERDGYWFFRDVLDKEAVGRLRAIYLKTLNELGVIDPTRTDAAVYNGASLDDYPIVMGGPPEEDPLVRLYPRDSFVNEPKIKQFFTELFGDEVFWVPNSEFQAFPPQKGYKGSRFNYLHCDGPNNKGLPLKVVWVPLATIDEDTGGLAVAEGWNKPRIGDFARPPEGIAYGAVPTDAWRRAVYQPGDLLVFSLETPHSGLANRSDKYFRLSMDIRGMKKSDNVPFVGKVKTVDANAISVKADDGREQTFRLDQDTFCRIYRGKLSGMPLELHEIPQLVKPGAPIYVASENGRARFIRPQH